MKVLLQEQYPILPKWPGVFVTGKSVTPEQAKEIIFRTDTNLQRGPSEFLNGNDKRFKDKCITAFGWDPFNAAQHSWWNLHKAEDEEAHKVAMLKILPANSGYEDLRDVVKAWKKELKIIDTEYVYNSFLSSAYAGGPTGWCHPSGNISVDGHNYGKWPTVEDIKKDWQTIAEAFPFLDLACTLFNKEYCEEGTSPICTIVVKSGAVQVGEPTMSLHDRNQDAPRDVMFGLSAMLRGMQSGSFACERAWPAGWLEEFAGKSKSAMLKVAPWL